MPQVTVYIRKEDLSKWEALEKKSEFIHNALNGVVEFKPGQEKALHDMMDASKEFLTKPIKTPKQSDDEKKRLIKKNLAQGKDFLDGVEWEGPMWKKGKKNSGS